MSDTVLFAKSHIARWHRAYLRGLIYTLIAVLPIFIDRLQQVNEFAAVSPVEWTITTMTAALAACNTVRCFLDKTITQITESKP